VNFDFCVTHTLNTWPCDVVAYQNLERQELRIRIGVKVALFCTFSVSGLGSGLDHG